MTTPWNTFANDNRNAQAWQAAPQNGATALLRAEPAGYAPTQTLPPAQQFPAAPQFDYGYPQQFPGGQPPKGSNKTALLDQPDRRGGAADRRGRRPPSCC